MSAVTVVFHLDADLEAKARKAGYLTDAAFEELLIEKLESHQDDQDLTLEPRFKPEVAEELRKFRQGEVKTFDADDVAKELSLNVG